MINVIVPQDAFDDMAKDAGLSCEIVVTLKNGVTYKQAFLMDKYEALEYFQKCERCIGTIGRALEQVK